VLFTLLQSLALLLHAHVVRGANLNGETPMLTRTLSAFAVAGLLIVVTGASVPNATASNETVSQPSCCIKHAYCCKLQRECCPNRAASDASVATVDADDAMAAVSRPSCCVKRAFCCTIQRECCHRGAASATTTDVTLAADAADSAAAKLSCCVKRAYCCKVVRECCHSANSASAVA
tara:strand:- start:17022 stop:17552 length:531 start_codon:yes stop_codon:yes gene_type:complete